MSASILIKKCCLTCKHANRRQLYPYAASFQVMCECPENPEQNFVHMARDFCHDKFYSSIGLGDLLNDLKENLEYHQEKFDYAIDATEAVIEGKSFSVDGQQVVNISEYTLAELEDIKNGIGRSVGLLQFFLAECLSPSQDQPSAPKHSKTEETDSLFPLGRLRSRLGL